MLDSLITRFNKAYRAFKGEAEVLGTMVRPSDVASGGRWAETGIKELVKRYSGWVKVAASRNATGVASIPLRVYSAKGGKSRSAWQTRRVKIDAARSVVGAAGNVTARKLNAIGEEMVEITDPMHPLVKVLNSANIRDNGYDLIETICLGLELTGNGYIVGVLGENQWPVELWPALPQYMRVLPDRVRFIRGYEYGHGEEVKQVFDVEQVCHFRMPNPLGDPYYGMGPLAAAVTTADIDTASEQHQLATINNGGAPGLVISAPNATPQQREQIEASLARKVKGAQNAGRSLVLAGDKDLTVQQWSMTEKEVSYLLTAQAKRDKIAAIFDLPTALLAQENAALATAQAAMGQWQMIALRPRKRRVEDALNAQLIPMFAALGDDSLCVAFDDPYTEDQSAATNRAIMVGGFFRETVGAVSSGMLPADAARVILKRTMPGEADIIDEAIEAAEQSFKIPAFDMRPPAQAPAPTPPPPAAEPDDEDDAVEDAAEAEDDTKEEAPAQRSASSSQGILDNCTACGCGSFKPNRQGILDSSKVRKWTDDIWPRDPLAVQRQQQDDKFANKWNGNPADGQVITMTERQLELALRRWFRSVTPAIEDGVNLETNGVRVDLAANDRAVDAFFEAAGKPMADAYRLGYNRASEDVSGMATIPTYEDVGEATAEYIRGYSKKIVKSVSDTVSERIKEALAQSVEAGEGMDEKALRIQQILGPGTEVASRRIAQTETIRLYVGAREEGWVKSGVVKGKRWMLSGNPCELCEALHEKFNNVQVGTPMLTQGARFEYGDGKVFVSDYDQMDGPPGHPNCACDIGPVWEDD